LERLDRLIARSEGIDPAALTFAFRPLWQMDAASQASVALAKAQATQIYAELNLWRAPVTARLVEAQLIEDGTYPGAEAVFAEIERAGTERSALDFDPNQRRDPDGRWTAGGPTTPSSAWEAGATARAGIAPKRTASSEPSGILSVLNPIGTAHAAGLEGEGENRPLAEVPPDPMEPNRTARYVQAWRSLKEIDPNNRALLRLEPPDNVPTEADIARIEGAAREAAIARTCDFLRPNGQAIGERGTSSKLRMMSGGLAAAQRDYDYLSSGSTAVPFDNGSMVRLPGGAGTITLRPVTSTPGSPAIDINIPGVIRRRLHY